VVTVAAAMSACVGTGHWQQALKLMESSMEKGRLRPNIVSYNVQISAYVSGSCWASWLFWKKIY